MGCTTSKIDNEEDVARCNTRKRHIREAVSSRHNFAAAFSNYVIALRTAGSAFSQFGEAEFRDPNPDSALPTPSPMMNPPNLPKPPPLPSFYPTSQQPQQQQTSQTMPAVLEPLKRAVSMPPLNFGHKKQEPPAPLAATAAKPARSSKKKASQSPSSQAPASASPPPELHPQQQAPPPPPPQEQKQEEVKKKSDAKVEDEEVWGVPSSHPPPPPPPPASPWGFDIFDLSHAPVPLQEPDEEIDDRKQQEERERQEHLEQQQRLAAAKRQEEEERKRKAELELHQRQEEEMKRRPDTVQEEEEDEEDEEEESNSGDEEEEEEEEEEAEEQDEPGKPASNSKDEEAMKKNAAANLDLPKTDLAIVTTRPGKDLVTVLKRIDDLFCEAYESGRDVASMLEAHRASFHPNFIDANSNMNHSKMVLRAISWSQTSVTKSDTATGEQAEDENGTPGTHASTLDRLLAWEKKLLEEVKRAEVIRIDYNRKNASLQREEARGGSPEVIEKLKASKKSLETRYAVALQGVDTARDAVLKLRDVELYPQLLELLEGLLKMWKKTYECHFEQEKFVKQMKPLDTSDVVESTNNLHKVATEQLKVALNRWYQFFNSVISSQREYMQHLNAYVRVSVVPFDTFGDKDKLSLGLSSQPPIVNLCHEWEQALHRLPDKALEPIKNFVGIIQEIENLQNEEAKQKKRVENLEKELEKKKVYVDNYEKKHLSTFSAPASEERNDLALDTIPTRNPLTEKRAQVQVMSQRLEEEKQKIERLAQSTKVMTVNGLQTNLSSIFHTVTLFARQCYEVHQALRAVVNTSLLTDK